MKPGPLITVRCVTPTCGSYDKHQQVPAGVGLAPTVILTGTLCCSLCGATVETVQDAADR